MIEQIRSLADQCFPSVQAIRHHIHANPELSFAEYETSEYISKQLSEIGIHQQQIIAETGIVALIEGREPERCCIALRADMDGLPIQELNVTGYRSKKPGVMHACGHDVHSACLLGVAQVLYALKDQLTGTIKLIFQPGEEQHPGGASLLIDAGVLDNPKPAAILALHVYPHLPVGTAGFRAGQYMASADEINITIHGKGGHAALPHQTIDPIAIAAQLITTLQQVISRRNNPLTPSVLSFGKIAGGTVNNVISDRVEILGTFRTMDEQWRYEAHRLIKEITHQTCAALGATAEVVIPVGYPSLFNDPNLTQQAIQWAGAYLGAEHVHHLDLRMAAEDFSYYTRHIPGCFFRIGTNDNNERFTLPVHNARFDIEEDAMRVGVGLMAWIATQALTNYAATS